MARNHSSVPFVITNFQQNRCWLNTLNQFMKAGNHTAVLFVFSAVRSSGLDSPHWTSSWGQEKCSICDYNSSQMGHFKMHIISVHEGQKPFKCSVCNNCSRKWVLTQLIALVHEGKKPLDCSICNYSCSQKGTLIKHIATLHEGKKTFKCSICDYCSSEKEQLKIHISSVHEGKKPFKCSICDYNFSKSGS